MTNPFSRWFGRRRGEERAPGSPTPGPAPAPAIRPEDYVGSDEAANERVVREGFAAKAKRYLRHMPMAEEAVALYFCMLDPATPLWVKGTAAAALAYFILPLDAIPDILPIVGLSDDAAVLAAALTAISAHVTAEHRRKARAWLEAEHIEVATTPGPGPRA